MNDKEREAEQKARRSEVSVLLKRTISNRQFIMFDTEVSCFDEYSETRKKTDRDAHTDTGLGNHQKVGGSNPKAGSVRSEGDLRSRREVDLKRYMRSQAGFRLESLTIQEFNLKSTADEDTKERVEKSNKGQLTKPRSKPKHKRGQPFFGIASIQYTNEEIDTDNDEEIVDLSRSTFSEHQVEQSKIPAVFEVGFDILEKSKECLVDYAMQIVHELDLCDNEKKLRQLLSNIQGGYRDNPYHNFHHGFFVFHMAAIFLTKAPVLKLSLSREHSLAFLIAAMAHDVDHPGYSNALENQFQTALSVRTKGKHVLEALHSTVLISMLNTPECDVFEKDDLNSIALKQPIYKFIIKLIISTDMEYSKSHQGFLKTTKSLQYTLFNDDMLKIDNKQRLFNALIHTCDVSAQCTDLEVAKKWERRMAMEFYTEADYTKQERGISAVSSMLKSFLDLDNVESLKLQAESQLGFLDFVVEPLWIEVARLIPSMRHLRHNMITIVRGHYQVLHEKGIEAAAKYDEEHKHSNILINCVYKPST